MFLGVYDIDEYVAITAATHRFSSGAAYAPTVLTYSIYEEGNTTGLDENVDMVVAAPFDSIVGVYYIRRQLTAAAGFERGKTYVVVIKATVDSVAANEVHVFQIRAAQTGDSYARLGAPAGASVSADVLVVKTKTDYLPAATAGAAGGVAIAGSNAATTFASLTCTGALTVSNGIAVTCSTANRTAITATGNGTGNGLEIASGSGLTGSGISVTCAATNGSAMLIQGSGSGHGISAAGGATGHGIAAGGGGTTGNGINATATYSGHGIAATGALAGAGITATGGVTGPGLLASGGGNNAAADGIKAVAGGALANGIETDRIAAANTMTITEGIAAAITGNITGNLSGSVGSVTGLTTAGITDAVWDEVLDVAHEGAGSASVLLQGAGAAGDPWVTALPGAYGAGTAGKIIGDNINAPIATVDTVVDAIKVDTAAILADTEVIGAPAGASISADIAAIEAQTDDIGAAGAGLTALASAANLATVAGYLDTEIAAIIATLGAAGAGLTALPWNAAWDAEVQSECTDALNAYDPPTKAELDAAMAALNDLSAAEVNAEVVDALATDTYAEPGQGNPAATTTLAVKLAYLYKAWRNRSTQTATEYALYADNATTKDQEAPVSDDATTFDRGEVVSGA
jgi:hypothetical protein